MKLNKGMTLTEILIVVSILGFLAVLTTIYLRSQIFKSYDARRKTEVKRIGIAVEEYEKDKDCYPTSVSCQPGTDLKPYLNEIPCDPTTKTSYYYQPEESSCPKWYKLFAVLQNESDVDYRKGIGPSAAFSFSYSSPNAPIEDIQNTANYYVGCKSGVCVPVVINPNTGMPSCVINYSGTRCLTSCGTPQAPENECVEQ